MCNKSAHFLNNCLILLEYPQIDKATRNVQNMVILGNRKPIPSDMTNCLWVAQINEYYARNPHLLPQETVQTNFSTNLLEVHG